MSSVRSRFVEAAIALTMPEVLKQQSSDQWDNLLGLKGAELAKINRISEYRSEWGQQEQAIEAAKKIIDRPVDELGSINLTRFEMAPNRDVGTFLIAIADKEYPNRLSFRYSHYDGQLKCNWPPGDVLSECSYVVATEDGGGIGRAIIRELRRMLPARKPPITHKTITVRLLGSGKSETSQKADP